MKRYTIGLTLLFALMNTGCEDAKAESKDYDVEIAELQQQVSQLNSRLDSLINVVPTNTNIAQLSSRLDSTISVIPMRKVYEGVVGNDYVVSIDIPEIKLTDMPIISVISENYINLGMQLGTNGYYRSSQVLVIEDGKLFADFSFLGSGYEDLIGSKFIISIIK